MKPEKIREDFPIFDERPELAYLDNAATSQKPESVIDAVENFYRENNSNIGRGLYELANDATQAYKDARSKVAGFINADSDEVIFVRNTTEAENLLASSLDFEGGIVLSKMAHHSEQLPWRRKADEEDKNIEYLGTENGKISIKSAKDKIDEDTGLVAISHISNVFGAENPVEEIIEIAHDNDALVVLDAAQSAPHRPLDVKDIDADFVAFSGHKMLGPSGTGVLYGKKELLQDMRPYQVGGGMINSVEHDEVKYADAPERFEAGTPNVAGAVGLAAAVEYLEDIGMENVSAHSKKLAEKMIGGLEEIEGIDVISPEGANLVSFTCEYAHPHDVAEVLNQHGVAVRAGHHCAQPQMVELDVNGATRASPYIYNTEEDVEKFLESVREASEIFNAT
ncbi:aminotransferase class V-fold PLP-dependent enzyme [Candidatus Nanosalina sp. VS9-1]|uniref:aminotransferase class V-fold PLP-dependent enzyme n=1 Tax=Candidatus Nanosalina sp. VS9-1 TaxID=3388566 RepID=UPI0039E11B9C